MKVLVVGSGGREHALCLALSKSSSISKLWCAPGNPGIELIAECVALNLSNKRAIVNFANYEKIDLVIVGPEGPLVDGLADDLAVFNIPCCGPSKEAAQLEGSKLYTKELCDIAGIPTAEWFKADSIGQAYYYIIGKHVNGADKFVIKAVGLAAGKGVIVAYDVTSALAAVTEIVANYGFPILIEEYLEGTEMSFFVLSNGKEAIPFGTAQDYKRLTSDPSSPNTGGMGAIAPSPLITNELENEIMQKIINPALTTMHNRGIQFKGFLFAGLMITNQGPKLIEFNARFGDPECQALMSLITNDILPSLYAAATGNKLPAISYSDKKAVAVVMTNKGYPNSPQKGDVIPAFSSGVDGKTFENINVFHSGTSWNDNDQIIASGGRVLTVCTTELTTEEARIKVYKAVDQLKWDNEFHRDDIGL